MERPVDELAIRLPRELVEGGVTDWIEHHAPPGTRASIPLVTKVLLRSQEIGPFVLRHSAAVLKRMEHDDDARIRNVASLFRKNDAPRVLDDQVTIRLVPGWGKQPSMDDAVVRYAVANLDATPAEYSNVFSINQDRVAELLRTFRSAGVFDWKGLSRDTAIDFTPELIEEFRDEWDWESLQKNSSVYWTFEMLEEHKERLDWYWVSKDERLPWTVERIREFSDWLGFSYKEEGALSESSVLPWSVDLVKEFEDRWGWYELSANTYLPWDAELINTFRSRWNYERLSANPAVPWSADMIDAFIDEWCWDKLSGNPALPWSASLLTRYEDRWVWSPDLGRGKYYGYWGYRRAEALVHNHGIPWTVDLLKRYRERIDFWILARCGSLPADVIVEFAPEWNRRERSSSERHTWSDEVAYSDVWLTGWDNLCMNDNVLWIDDLLTTFRERLDFSLLVGRTNIEISLDLLDRVWHRKYDKEQFYASRSGLEAEVCEHEMKGVFKNATVTGTTYEDLLEREIEWAGTIVSHDFINASIWLNCLRPQLDDEALGDLVDTARALGMIKRRNDSET